MKRPRPITTTLLAGVLLAGCTAGDADNDEAPPIPQNESGQPEDDEDDEEDDADSDDPFAVPDEIDEGYAQLVVDELMPIAGEAEQIALDEAPAPMPPDEAMARYQAVYTPAISSMLLASLSTDLSDEEAVAERLEQIEAGQTRWVLDEVGDADDTCIPMTFVYDVPGQVEERDGVAALLPKEDEGDPDEHNPTPWTIGLSGPLDGVDHDLTSICTAARDTEDDAAEQAEPDGVEEQDA